MADAKAPDAYIAVVTDQKTGLYHGAVYRNKPTPSGCDRYILGATINEGHATLRAAAVAANAAFPSLEPLDLSGLPDDAFPEGGFAIPRGALVTRITTQRARDPMEEGQPGVEVTLGRKVLDIAITPDQFDRLVALGHLRNESCSGRDPNLYYYYDHYVVTDVGRRFHPLPKAA